ncbi:hypothetical protein B0H16DRAFT_1482860 [Mycena metata]|uniref:Uncharacterized protein n=1 Tax=Mycena metata TaxID=1033252 RepID=A0AAD7M6K1_9AGAR|nr:hypothetical protein B0H16DRAFT_1482860 [Mycena metata]
MIATRCSLRRKSLPCEVAWKEAAAVAKQYCGMEIPDLPLRSTDLHPRFRAATGLPPDNDPVESEHEDDSPSPVAANNADFDSNVIRIPPHAEEVIADDDNAHTLGKDLTAELEAIDKELDANPDTPVLRIQIASLLNPAPKSPAILVIPTFLISDGTIFRQDLVAQRRRHCALSQVHSEQTRKLQTNVEYLGGKFSLNHAAHQLKEAGPAAEWREGCRLDVAVTDIRAPDKGSLVIMRSAVRLYLGEVLGIYRYGSVSGKHESYTDAETVDDLSYLCLRCSRVQHIVPVRRRGDHPLPLFTHAPISELVYLLTYTKLDNIAPETYSISGGDTGWECWHALTSSTTVYRMLNLPTESPEQSDDEDENDYDEPKEGSSSKKRKPKAPRDGQAGLNLRKDRQQFGLCLSPIQTSTGFGTLEITWPILKHAQRRVTVNGNDGWKPDHALGNAQHRLSATGINRYRPGGEQGLVGTRAQDDVKGDGWIYHAVQKDRVLSEARDKRGDQLASGNREDKEVRAEEWKETVAAREPLTWRTDMLFGKGAGLSSERRFADKCGRAKQRSDCRNRKKTCPSHRATAYEKISDGHLYLAGPLFSENESPSSVSQRYALLSPTVCTPQAGLPVVAKGYFY